LYNQPELLMSRYAQIADDLAFDESTYDSEASSEGGYQLVYAVPSEGEWIEANYEELESMYLAMKDYVAQYALPFLRG